jgi:hypothetical protein
MLGHYTTGPVFRAGRVYHTLLSVSIRAARNHIPGSVLHDFCVVNLDYGKRVDVFFGIRCPVAGGVFYRDLLKGQPNALRGVSRKSSPWKDEIALMRLPSPLTQ